MFFFCKCFAIKKKIKKAQTDEEKKPFMHVQSERKKNIKNQT